MKNNIKILKINKDGSLNMQIGEQKIYGCYPVSFSYNDKGWDPLDLE